VAKFGLIYVGEPQFDDPEAAQAHQQRFMAWLADLGDAVINPGMPFGAPTRISADGISENTPAQRLTGITIYEAEDKKAAIAIAQTCPYIEVAAVDVVQIFHMQG